MSVVESVLRPRYAVGDKDDQYIVRRCFVWAGVPPVAGAPTAGGDIDGVCAPDGEGNPDVFYPAIPGVPVRVEAAAAFSSGATLETDANGRVKTVVSGKGVLRALEAASALGDIRWAVFTSGR